MTAFEGDPIPDYFTFQYVSINTEIAESNAKQYAALHSNMFLLIREAVIHTESQYLPLHSNMFLLIRDQGIIYGLGVINFTFQYVSINTVPSWLLFLYPFLLYIPICFY